MKKLFYSFLVLATLGAMFLTMAYWPYKNSPEVELEIRNRTVKINTIDSSKSNTFDVYGCTGTLLSHNYIITNAHCFPHPKEQIYIRKINDTEFTPAIMLSSATITDFALLGFGGVDTSTPVTFSTDWKLGEDIILFGNPGSRDFVLGHSRIVAYSFILTPLHKLRTMIIYPCNEAAPGFSGSGIYNMHGEYLGTHELGEEIPLLDDVLTKLAGEERHGPLCFAIPAKEIIERNLDKPWFGYNMEDK